MLNVDVGLAFTRSGYDWSMQSAVGGCSSILSAMVRVWTSRFWRRAGIRTGSEVVRKVFLVCHGGSFTRHPKTSCAIQTISVACMYQIVLYRPQGLNSCHSLVTSSLSQSVHPFLSCTVPVGTPTQHIHLITLPRHPVPIVFASTSFSSPPPPSTESDALTRTCTSLPSQSVASPSMLITQKHAVVPLKLCLQVCTHHPRFLRLTMRAGRRDGEGRVEERACFAPPLQEEKKKYKGKQKAGERSTKK